jgi:hypothetical protein
MDLLYKVIFKHIDPSLFQKVAGTPINSFNIQHSTFNIQHSTFNIFGPVRHQDAKSTKGPKVVVTRPG